MLNKNGWIKVNNNKGTAAQMKEEEVETITKNQFKALEEEEEETKVDQ